MNTAILIQEILETGMTQEEIASHIRKALDNSRFSQATVSRIKNGASTSYTVGREIEKLHQKAKARKAKPRPWATSGREVLVVRIPTLLTGRF